MSYMSKRFPPEVREQAVGLICDHGADYPSDATAIRSIRPEVRSRSGVPAPLVPAGEDRRRTGRRLQQLREDVAAGLSAAVCERLGDPAWRTEAVAVLTRRITELSA